MRLHHVFDQRDAGKGYREYPNRVIATEILEAEISRLTFALPGQSAICCRTGAGITIKKNGRAIGGSTASGLFYPSGTGTPNTSLGEVSGSPGIRWSAVWTGARRGVPVARGRTP